MTDSDDAELQKRGAARIVAEQVKSCYLRGGGKGSLHLTDVAGSASLSKLQSQDHQQKAGPASSRLVPGSSWSGLAALASNAANMGPRCGVRGGDQADETTWMILIGLVMFAAALCCQRSAMDTFETATLTPAKGGLSHDMCPALCSPSG